MPKCRDTSYSIEQERIVVDHITVWRKNTIARKLGKSVSAVRAWCNAHGISPRKRHLLTSGQAARMVGCSCQWLTELARAGRLKARREPGGRWWLFDPRNLKQLVVAPEKRIKRQRAGRIGARLRWRCGL